MPLHVDPELAALAAAQVEDAVRAGAVAPAPGDVAALRAMATISMTVANARTGPAPDVTVHSSTIAADDGAEVEVRWYERIGRGSGPAIVYAHGGGMVSGSLDIFEPVLRWYAQVTGVPLLAVEYRLAPEWIGETAPRDVLAAIRWLLARADDLGVDPARVAVMGDSAGGGIAAGAAILARDTGIQLARQILIYPMLDDRTLTPDPQLVEAFWDYDMNATGWAAKRGSDADAVSAVAAPGRLSDFAGLPAAYLEVGTVDIFRDEVIRFAQGLLAVGVDVDLHLLPGAPHSYDTLGPASAYAERWRDARLRAMTSF